LGFEGGRIINLELLQPDAVTSCQAVDRHLDESAEVFVDAGRTHRHSRTGRYGPANDRCLNRRVPFGGQFCMRDEDRHVAYEAPCVLPTVHPRRDWSRGRRCAVPDCVTTVLRGIRGKARAEGECSQVVRRIAAAARRRLGSFKWIILPFLELTPAWVARCPASATCEGIDAAPSIASI
jgi:hypothetical protein